MPAGRPRKETIENVIAAALETFGRQGFRGASLSELESATGLKKGSLYKAFADKRELFLRALDLYLSEGLERQRQALAPPGAALARLDAWTRLLTQACSSGGCFAVKTAEELAGEDPDVRERLTTHWAAVRSLLVPVLAEAQQSGEIQPGVAPEDLGHLLVRFSMGAATGAKLEPCESTDRAWIALLDLMRASAEKTVKN